MPKEVVEYVDRYPHHFRKLLVVVRQWSPFVFANPLGNGGGAVGGGGAVWSACRSSDAEFGGGRLQRTEAVAEIFRGLYQRSSLIDVLLKLFFRELGFVKKPWSSDFLPSSGRFRLCRASGCCSLCHFGLPPLNQCQ